MRCCSSSYGQLASWQVTPDPSAFSLHGIWAWCLKWRQTDQSVMGHQRCPVIGFKNRRLTASPWPGALQPWTFLSSSSTSSERSHCSSQPSTGCNLERQGQSSHSGSLHHLHPFQTSFATPPLQGHSSDIYDIMANSTVLLPPIPIILYHLPLGDFSSRMTVLLPRSSWIMIRVWFRYCPFERLWHV